MTTQNVYYLSPTNAFKLRKTKNLSFGRSKTETLTLQAQMSLLVRLRLGQNQFKSFHLEIHAF